MSERTVPAHEHEGTLGSPEEKKARDRANSRSNQIINDNLNALTENTAFCFWFSRFFVPMIYQPQPADQGARLAAFAGKRELLLQIVAEMDTVSPGFVKRLLEAREDYELALARAAQGEEN